MYISEKNEGYNTIKMYSEVLVNFTMQFLNGYIVQLNLTFIPSKTYLWILSYMVLVLVEILV